jgi:hypothetical protein
MVSSVGAHYSKTSTRLSTSGCFDLDSDYFLLQFEGGEEVVSVDELSIVPRVGERLSEAGRPVEERLERALALVDVDHFSLFSFVG